MTRVTTDVWDRVLDTLRKTVGEAGYQAWLHPTVFDGFDENEGRVTLVVPNEFYRSWVTTKYLKEISRAFDEILEQPVTIDLRVAPPAVPASPAIARPGRQIDAGRRGDVDTEELHDTQVARGRAPSVPQAEKPAADCRLNPRYVFAEFVVGESNRFAHAAAQAVAESGTRAFNPLFIYGTSGLGKTHLMQAIGNQLRAQDRSQRVLYVTSEQFINQFIDSIQARRPVEFRDQIRSVDLLLIDDVQFLAGKERTQQEFFHTFNALYDAGKKIVVSSDRSPKELVTLEERLRSRFEWGLIVDVQPPDLETRLAILQKKAEFEGIRLPHDVALFLAERIKSNVRELEGVLKQLRMYAALHSVPMNLETARAAMGHLVSGQNGRRGISAEEIQRAVCEYFDISVKDLLGGDRSKKFSYPRHMAQYLARELMEGFSFPDIAQVFGGKDHTSVIYAHRKIKQMAADDANVANIVAYLTRQITKGAGG